MELGLLAGVVVLSVVIGVVWSRRQGVVRGPRADGAQAPVDWAGRGVLLGERTTFVQFSAQVCAACRSTARVLGTMSAPGSGVAHHEIDVEDDLALTGSLGILRTPTTLVLDGDGREVARMSGAVTPAQAREALTRGTT
ncbi:thioredoxin family protein [Myceligenerans crystallogenes]|uniref:Thioredoxin family protein n=1 Tax=Myceligenerans crystallogenes TaxID=316335 RepID=A0ABP4ZTV3_9MICO